MKFTAILFLLTVQSLSALAQPADSISLKKNYLPSGIRFGVDLISLAKIPLSKEFDGWEASADLDFNRYYLTAEVGNWQRSIVSPDQTYSNTGNYFRIGADINFLLKDPDKNMFFVGLRYARSSFSEQFNFASTDVVYGDVQRTVVNDAMRAGWGEITVGLRVKIWKELWMGYTARIKVAPSIANQGEFISYDIPGYGLAAKNSYWGFNYQIFWRFPFRH